MAELCFFQQTIKDLKADTEIALEFGRSGDRLIYFKVGDKTVIVDEATGRKICQAMASLGGHLGYDK